MNWISEFVYNVKKGNRWGGICVLNYRIAHFFTLGRLYIIGWPFLIYYHFVFRHIVGFDLHEKAEVGIPFSPWHCFGIAINPHVKIGKYVKMAHNTTLGQNNGKSPIIEDYVILGPSVSVIGDVTIGKESVIGIGSVVTKSIPCCSVAVGNPAKIIRKI